MFVCENRAASARAACSMAADIVGHFRNMLGMQFGFTICMVSFILRAEVPFLSIVPATV